MPRPRRPPPPWPPTSPALSPPSWPASASRRRRPGARTMPEPLFDAAAVARRALPLLDLTDLGDTCTTPQVDALCREARGSGVAAICVWPQFVSQGVRALAGSGVRVATVINF